MNDDHLIDIVLQILSTDLKRIGRDLDKGMFKSTAIDMEKSDLNRLYHKLKYEGLIEDREGYNAATETIALSDKAFGLLEKFGSWTKHQESLGASENRMRRNRKGKNVYQVLTLIFIGFTAFATCQTKSANERVEEYSSRVSKQAVVIDSLQRLNTQNQNSMLKLQSAMDTTKSQLEGGQIIQ